MLVLVLSVSSVDTIRKDFERFGEINDVYLPLDFNTRRPRGFCFIEFAVEADADEAQKAMDGKDIDGRSISCSNAKDGRKEPCTLRLPISCSTFSPPLVCMN